MKKTKENFQEKPLKPKRHPIRQKLLSCLLSVCLLLVSLPVEFYGSEVQAEEMVQEIMSFSELPEEVQNQTADKGTAQESLSLPDTLWAVCVFTESEPVMLEHITWQSAPAYDRDTEGTYVFTPVLPESFVLAEGAVLPEINVTVMNTVDMLPEKETVQTLEEPEEILMEGSKSDRDFAEDMDLQMDRIPEDRIAVTAEEGDAREQGEEPECKVITQDTVWKEGNLEGGTVTLENNATLTIRGRIIINGDVTIEGTGTIIRGTENAGFEVPTSSGHKLAVNGGIILDGNEISAKIPFICMYGGNLELTGCTLQDMKYSGSNGLSNVAIVSNGQGTFTDTTVKNCVLLSSNGKGGAIYNMGTLTLVGGSYENNSSPQDGGCIYNGGHLTINEGMFSRNTTEENGGFICSYGRYNKLIITGGTFSENTAKTGGCIYVPGNPDWPSVDIYGGAFSKNRAQQGGCIYAKQSININGGTFSENTAENGGCIYSAGSLRMGNEKSVRADFSKNTATQRGGCIYGDLTIEGGDSSNITFSENTAEQGGCIYSPDSTTLEAGTFSGNTAQQGGCIYSEKYLQIYGAVFHNNDSEEAGGAIYSYIDTDGRFDLYGNNTEFQGIDDSPVSCVDSIYLDYTDSMIHSPEKWTNPVKIFVNAERQDKVVQGEGRWKITEEDLENIHVYDRNTKKKCDTAVDKASNYVYITPINPGTYNIFYNSNGAQGTPVTDSTDYKTGEKITVKEPTGLSIAGQTFKEWNTQEDGKGTAYAPGDEITVGEENITLYAIFEEEAKDTFTARFYSGKAGKYTDQEAPDGTLEAPEPEALGDGWTMLGWNRKQDDFEKNSIAPGDTITLTDTLTEFYGVYQKEVTLTCETDGEEKVPGPEQKTCYASVHNEIKVKGAVFTVKAGPVRKGYKFLGWNTQEDGKGAFYQEKESLTTDKNVTLYVCYEKEDSGTKTLIADFYSGSGGGKESRTVEVNGSGQEGTIHTPKLQEMVGWTSLGWSYSDSEYKGTTGEDTDIKIAEHISLYGVYKKDITLTYDGNGSADVPEPEMKSRYANVHGTISYQDAEFIIEAESTRAGCRFVGWNTQADGKGTGYEKGDVVSPEENMTLYAIWEEDPEVVDYQVEYYCQNLTGEDYTRIDNDTKHLADRVGTEVEARQKKYTGYTLNLNHPSGKPKGKVEQDGSLVLKLYYDRNIYEVEFNLNGGYGTTPDTQKVRYGGKLEQVADPVKSGYNFKGWYMYDKGLEVGLWDFESPVENNTGMLKTTLYAKWADETAPVMGEASFSKSHKNLMEWLIQKKSLVITVPVREEGSGLARAEYLLIAEDGTEKDDTAQITETGELAGQMTPYGSSASVIRAVQGEAERGSYEARIVIEEEFKGKVYLTCTDNAGNISSQKMLTAEDGGVILEDNAPKISFSGTKETTGGKPLEVKVEVKDSEDGTVAGGISSVSYQADKGKKITLPEEEFSEELVESCEFTVKISGEGKHTLQVEAEDHAGNKSRAEISLKINGEKNTPAEVPNSSGTGGTGKPGNPLGGEPKTGDSTQIQICATLAMIAGFGYLLLYFEGENGITEQEKEEIVYRLVEWAKQGGKIRRLLGVAVIFLFLAYYHSIGKSVTVEWREVCVEKAGRNSGF